MVQISKISLFFLVFLISESIKAQDSLKVIYVKWEDIVNTDSGWHTIKESVDFATDEISTVNQVGFLLRKDDKYLIMTESFFDGENGNLGTVIRIPVCNILEYQVVYIKINTKK